MVGKISVGSSGGLEYLESGEDKNRVDENGKVITRKNLDNRKKISGDMPTTKLIIDNINKNKKYKTSYYHLTFSFKEEMSNDKMQMIFKEVEDFYLSGFEKREYDIYAEIHRPKNDAKYKYFLGEDRGVKQYKLLSEDAANQIIKNDPDQEKFIEKRHDHFHVIIPKINLLTGTQLKITEKDETKNIDAFHEYINIKYGLESAKENKRDISDKQYKSTKYTKDDLADDLNERHFKDLTNKQTKETLLEMIEISIKKEIIKDYSSLLVYLKTLSFTEFVKEVNTKQNQYIKIKILGQDKNVNLRNKIFTKDFWEQKDIALDKEIRRIEGKSLDDYKEIIDSYKERRGLEVSKRYDFARKRAITKDLIDKSLQQKFENEKESTNTKNILATLENQNVFLSGGAGVGKTFITKEVIKSYEDKNEKVVKLGSTGLASLNIDGSTLHSFFGIGINKTLDELKKVDNENEYFEKNLANIKEQLKDTKLIIIDEISMVSAEQMQMIEYRLEQADYKGSIMVVGDFFQLPPVKAEYAFTSPSWSKFDFKMQELTEIKRSDNKKFSELLNRLRYGKLDDDDLKFLKSKQLSSKENNLDKNLKIEENFNEERATYIYSNNKDVQKRNEKYLHTIDAEFESYKSYYKIDQKEMLDDTKKDLADELFKLTPFEKNLDLKVGARVLISANDKKLDVVNGEKGIYKGLENNKLKIKLDRDGREVLISKKQLTARDDFGNEITVTNYPVRLAYAITTHKSQGMSIADLAIDPNRQFLANQFYVALSRAKNPESLKILPFDDDPRSVKLHKYDLRNVLLQDNDVFDFYHPDIRSADEKEFDRKIKERQQFKKEEYNKKESPKKEEKADFMELHKKEQQKRDEIERESKKLAKEVTDYIFTKFADATEEMKLYIKNEFDKLKMSLIDRNDFSNFAKMTAEKEMRMHLEKVFGQKFEKEEEVELDKVDHEAHIKKLEEMQKRHESKQKINDLGFDK